MSEDSSFFSDPKVYLALLALILSIVSFCFTIFNQVDQNSKWEKLNEPNVDLKEAKFQNWHEIKKEEAFKIEWGYNPILYQKPGSFNDYILPYYLVLRDSITNQRVPNTNIVFTVNDANKELERVKYDKKKKVYLNKSFRASFILENLGKTIAKSLFLRVKAKDLNGTWVDAFTSNEKIALSPNLTTSIYIDLDLPILADLPETLSYILNIEWKNSSGKLTTKEIPINWIKQSNSWTFGNVE